MSERNLFQKEQDGGLTDVHRHTYRFFCVIASLLNPVFGIVYHITDPTAIDPLWARFAVAICALLLLSFSFMNDWVRERFIQLVHTYFYLLIVYLVGLTALNNFSPNYSLGMMFAITAVGLILSLGLRRKLGPLRRYLAFSILLTGPAALLVDLPQVSVLILWICGVSIALVIYIVADAKIKAEKSVEASEERYHTLMSSASDAIVISDPSTGMPIDANRKAEELLGRSLDQIQRMRVAELFPPADRERYTALFEAHAFERKPIDEDLFVLHQSGECIAVDLSASLVDVGGRKLIQSIFRRHRYEQQLIHAKERAEELLQLKTSLLNNVSHELRTPISAILGYAELMNEEAGQDVQEYADVIITSARRLQVTLNSILGLAQLESGDANLDLEPVDVADFAESALPLLKPLADKKGLELRTRLASGNAFALVDRVCLDRIMNNLVGNAIKFTERGSITITVDASADEVYLSVQDTGIGISESFMPYLFQEFRQESTGLARHYEGTGLGLAITKRLTELLNGTITIDSERGRGSIFTIAFPRLSLPANGNGAAESDEYIRPQPTTRRVLVVEDNAYMRNLLVKRLEGYFEVESAADPDAALKLAGRRAFDAFFVDINLGVSTDGVNLLRTLREIQGHSEAPAVALTAYVMPGDEEYFLDTGFTHYLSKPFTQRQLLKVAGQIIEAFGDVPEPESAFARASSAN